MSLNKLVARLGRGVESEEVFEIGQKKLGFSMMRVTDDGTVFYLGEDRVLRVTETETQILPFSVYKEMYDKK